MSHPFEEAMAPGLAKYREAVMQETFGHLAPKRGKTYRGYIVFAVGCFGSDPLNPIALECEFKGLDSSPWFFEAMTTLLGELKTEAGNVYRWEGIFRNYEFAGTMRKVKLVPAETR